MNCLYKKYAKYYDLLYSQKKDYATETAFIIELFRKYGSWGSYHSKLDILEVGCGTGGHAIYLAEEAFNITGVDLNEDMLKIARQKSDDIKFLQGDMKNFDLGKKFDYVLCLFSAIHYNTNMWQLGETIRNFHKHLKKGGILIFDMGFNEERWNAGKVHTMVRSSSGVDMVRFGKSRREGNVGIIDMGYIIYKDNEFNFGEESHKMGIFKTSSVKRLAEAEGFQTELYENYTLKLWTEDSDKYVVFACVKK